MTAIDIVLPEQFSDWECSLLGATAGTFLGWDVRHLSPTGRAVRSMSGLLVHPDEGASPESGGTDAVVFCGGGGWAEDEMRMAEFALRARARGSLIAAICDGTRVLAHAGILNAVGHTSNDPTTVQVPGYTGRDRYVSRPQAVRDRDVVTASGTSPVSFAKEVLTALVPAGGELDSFLARFSAEHRSSGGLSCRFAPE